MAMSEGIDYRLVLGETHEVEFQEYGVAIRKRGEPWPEQVLSYGDLKQLLNIKNRIFAECNGDMLAGKKAFRKEVAEELLKHA